MGYADRQGLLNDLFGRLGAVYPSDLVRDITRITSEILTGYEVTRTAEPGADADGADLLRAFLDAKTVQGRTEKTLERYRYVLTRMLSEIGAPARAVTAYYIRAYMMRLKESGCKDSTIEGMRCIYNSFFGWLHREGILAVNPCANIGTVKIPKVSRLPFSDTEIEQIKEACPCDRDRALIAFLLSTGCRISEVCALNRESVDFQRLQCTVQGKGRKERTVYIDTVTAMLLRRYLRGRSDACPALFAGRGAARLHPDGARLAIKRIAARASVAGAHPHRFRRTTATRLINRGMPVQDVAQILGHENLNTTMRYIYISNESVRYQYQRAAG